MTDWTGNKRTVFSIIGASNHSETERQGEDYYASSPDTLDHLARKYQIPHVVWEPSCGGGHLSRWLTEHGHKVYSTDLVDRGYGEGGVNFFEQLTAPADVECILTNPPYKWSTEYVLHALRLLPDGGQLVLLLKTTFLETERRYNEIFRNYPPPLRLPVRPSRPLRQERRLRRGPQAGQCGQLRMVCVGEGI